MPHRGRKRRFRGKSRRGALRLPALEPLEQRLLLDSTTVFNEILYSPSGGDDSLEWIELHNQLAVDMDLSGWTLDGGIRYGFAEGTTIAGGGYLVVAKDPTALAAAAGVAGALGPFQGQLDNGGELLQLRNNSGRVMDALDYSDRGLWPAGPDGSGAALAKIDPRAGSRLVSSWAASSQIGGTPGQANAVAAATSALQLNEVGAGPGGSFFVEIVNQGEVALDLAGYLVASSQQDSAYVVPAGTTIEPGAFLAFDQTALRFTAAAGDRLFLYGPGQATLVDAVRMEGALRGRTPDGTWLAAAEATPGSANRFALHDEIVINEIQYHPPAAAELPGSSAEEWIELLNRGAAAVDLSGWRLADAVDFQFAPGTILPPGQYLVVARDAAALASKYPAIAGRIVGDFARSLSNRADRIVLSDDEGNPADEVHYYASGRWPWQADGGGSTLELRDPAADNTKAEAWAASREQDRSEWQSFVYQGVAFEPAGSNNPAAFDEFILGLLDAGTVLLDDIHLVEDPAGAAIERLQNGSFEADAVGVMPAAWRIIGNHSASRVIVDPTDPGNQVLSLATTGATEHMHNHAETTLADGAEVMPGQEYRISFRAKWVAGSNQLNTRLYFNQLARTTLLDVPQRHGTPGARNSASTANIGPTYDGLRHGPVVPAAAEPVIVSVSADDPDGVAAVVLQYSVDGGPWTAVAMAAAGGGFFEGVIPGQLAASTVQFYVEGTDGAGAVSTFPAAGRDSRALYRVEDGRAGTGPHHDFRILMTQADYLYQIEETNVMSNQRLGATVVVDEQEVYYDVGVRLKGTGFSRATNVRGYNVRFHPDRLFRGVHDTVAVDLNGGSFGPGASHRELVVKQVANHAGGIPNMYDDLINFIPPGFSQVRTAQLLMARYDDDFLDSSFENGSDGTRFKMELIYFSTLTTDGDPESPKRPPAAYSVVSVFPALGIEIGDMGADKEAYRLNFLIKNHRARDDYGPIIELGRTLSLEGSEIGGPLDLRAQAVMDVDQWMRVFAFESLVGLGDTYNQGAPHNIQFYARPEDGRLLALPWDQDLAFSGDTTFPVLGKGSNLSKVINIPTNRRLFYGHVLDIINTTYNASYLTPWVEHYREFAAKDQTDAILNFVQARTDFVLGQLPAAVPFQITTNDGNDFVVDADVATLEGNGWIDVREVRLAGSDEPLAVTWIDQDSWQLTLPVAAGPQQLVLEAFNRQGERVGSDEITITSTAGNPVHEFLRISELNYHPYDPLPAFGDLPVDPDRFEFIEFWNTSASAAIDLAGVSLTDGVSFTFGAESLDPGARVLVVRDRAAFESRYGAGYDIAGEFASGKLANGGETVRLEDAAGHRLVEFTYADGGRWPGRADGKGATLEPVDPAGDYNDPANWRSSPEYGGSPGVAAAGPRADVVVNEVLPRPGGGRDKIELVNTSARPVDLSGWYVSDSSNDLLRSTLPAGTTIAAGARLVLDERQFGFGLNGAEGEDIWLIAADTDSGKPLRFADHVEFAGAEVNQTLGRWPDAAPGAALFPLSTPTLGQSNRGPLVGPVRISEIQYHPLLPQFSQSFDTDSAGLTPRQGEWVVAGGRYQATPGAEGDTIATIAMPGPLTDRFEFAATMRTVSGTGFKRNAALLFDYVSSTNFKFVSLHTGIGQWRIGQRDATGWHFLDQRVDVVAADVDYDVALSVAGSRATFRVGGVQKLAYDFGESLGDGQAGLGSKTGSAAFAAVAIAAQDRAALEFVELTNITAGPVALRGWQLAGAVAENFPPGTVLPAGQSLVVVGFDPHDETKTAAFADQYGLTESIVLAGPYTGEFSGGAALVRLLRPLGPAGATGGLALVDRVAYDVASPWPAAADGGGPSLTRAGAQAFGDFASSWSAATPTPGQADLVRAGDMDGNGRTDVDDIGAFVLGLRNAALYEQTFAIPAWLAGDADGDGDQDFDDIAGFAALLAGPPAAGAGSAAARALDTSWQHEAVWPEPMGSEAIGADGDSRRAWDSAAAVVLTVTHELPVAASSATHGQAFDADLGRGRHGAVVRSTSPQEHERAMTEELLARVWADVDQWRGERR